MDKLLEYAAKLEDNLDYDLRQTNKDFGYINMNDESFILNGQYTYEQILIMAVYAQKMLDERNKLNGC